MCWIRNKNKMQASNKTITKKYHIRKNSVLQETVHVCELMNSNMCFVCVSCLNVVVMVVVGVVMVIYVVIFSESYWNIIQASREPFMCMNL